MLLFSRKIVPPNVFPISTGITGKVLCVTEVTPGGKRCQQGICSSGVDCHQVLLQWTYRGHKEVTTYTHFLFIFPHKKYKSHTQGADIKKWTATFLKHSKELRNHYRGNKPNFDLLYASKHQLNLINLYYANIEVQHVDELHIESLPVRLNIFNKVQQNKNKTKIN